MMRNSIICTFLLLLCAILFWLECSAGEITLGEDVFYTFRLPRVMAATLSGMGLSMGGLAMQTLFRNPLAGPYLSGATPGASFAIAIFMMVIPSGFLAGWLQSAGIAVIGMAGSILVLILQLAIQRKDGNTFTLLISGVLFGYLLGAGTEILEGISQAEQVKSFVMWGLGSFDRVQNSEIPIFAGIIITALVAIWLLRFRMNAYLPGDTYAISAGLDLPKFRMFIVILAGLTSGVITGFCGPIGFVGMIAPHFARGLVKSNDHGTIWLPTLFCGILLCLMADLISHHSIDGIILPTNAVCAIIGSPALLWIILRRK